MAEHKCPKCGNVFSGGICCNKCGNVFLFNDEYNNKSEEAKNEEIKQATEKYEIANEIISSSPQNDFEARRREIIEDLIHQRKEREQQKIRLEEELKLKREKEEEERKAREIAREEARLKGIEEARIAEEKRLEEERIAREKKELEERYAAIRKAEKEKKKLKENEELPSDEETEVLEETEIEETEEIIEEDFENEEDATYDEEIEEDEEIGEDEETEYIPDEYYNEKKKRRMLKQIEGDTLLSKTLRRTLVSLYVLSIVFAVLPFTKLIDISVGYSFGLIDFIVLMPLVCGLLISIFERGFIRKYIFGTVIGAIYLAGYVVLKKSIPPSSILDLLYMMLFALTFLVSITGLFVDKNTAFKKMCVCFDSVVYVIFFVNMFVFIFLLMLNFIASGFVTGIIRVYVIFIMAVTLLNSVACLLMHKHKTIGADLFVGNSIVWIILVIVAYNQMMNSVGYGINFEYMHTLGNIYSYFIGACVVFPIVMFLWLKLIRNKEVCEV